TVTVDNTVTGSFSACEWKTNKLIYNADTFYGNGVLFYGASQAKIRGVSDYVGTLRVELMRDGIEEYQMLKMLEEYKGEMAAKAVVSRVSTNIVRYLSLPGFDRSAFASSMDEYDIMAEVRKDLGNAVEAAAVSGRCDHRWSSGTVTEEAGCLTVGTVVYSCTSCNAQYDRVIPAKHSAGDCFEKISGTAATCTEDGSEIFRCTDCGYKKTVVTTAFHNDKDYYRYTENSGNAHNVFCTVCSEKITAEAHISVMYDTATCDSTGTLETKCRFCGYVKDTGIGTPQKEHVLIEATVDPTCTSAGYTGTVCKNCDFAETTVIPEKGHSYVDGVCTSCGEAEPIPDVIKGDVSGDGKINGMDINIAKRILSGTAEPTDEQLAAADVTGDGTFNGLDANLLSRFISGSINDFN
ncbi:MAG: DUF4091 domain-containing protein, partial [Clostridia bacterium]|nr:DUF4091 domain-containing protein [Clostridia bacterium]